MPPEETRKMVGIMVEMERNYITAEYFRTIQVGGLIGGVVVVGQGRSGGRVAGTSAGLALGSPAGP